jgi:hypothetical protein
MSLFDVVILSLFFLILDHLFQGKQQQIRLRKSELPRERTGYMMMKKGRRQEREREREERRMMNLPLTLMNISSPI